jgi:hypothetical protein
MTAAFDARPKRRLNRVMDALNFEYPDYERLNKGAEGAKRKRVVSILSRQAARMVKEDEKILKKRKSSPEPKATALKKRKAVALEPKMTEVEEETPSTPTTTEVEDILKVMTESLPIKLLCPLGLHLTKLFQKKQEPSATKKADGLKKRRIGSVMQAIEKTPPSTSVSKIAPTASTEATAETNTSAEAAAATEAINLSTEATNLDATLFGIDKLLLDMGTEETVAAAEHIMAPVPDKGKKIVEATSAEEGFELQNMIGQELSESEKKELQEYDISCGYQPGRMLFGGINEEALGCVHDRIEAKVIGTLSKSVGFPKLEADISSYRRQHIVGSLFYSNFKVRFL